MATRERHTVRGLVLDPQDRLLLIQSDDPDHGGLFWQTPGGGREPGELPGDCLRRELYEETGLRQFEAGPLVWTREYAFEWKGDFVVQYESFYLVRTPSFTPTMEHNPALKERSTLRGFRWWTSAEIQQSTDLFIPGRVGLFLSRLLRDGPPPEPIDVGV